LATSTGTQLEHLWDQIGYTRDDRALQLSELLHSFSAICEQKIAEEQALIETYRATIADVQQELKSTSDALKVVLPENQDWNQSDSKMTLTQELSTLEASLEGLRTAATTAREDLTECRAYLIEVHEAMELEMDPKWRDVETDLTAARREQFHAKRNELKEELTIRSRAVIQLVRDCQQLMSDLRVEPVSELDQRIAGSLARSKENGFIMASKLRSNTCVGIGSTAVDELTKRLAVLHGEKRNRKQKLQDMGAEIAMLWEKLRVPDDEQLAFTESVQGLGMDTIEKGEA
jgi:protein regulator of cytokinesis 1